MGRSGGLGNHFFISKLGVNFSETWQIKEGSGKRITGPIAGEPIVLLFTFHEIIL